MRNERERLSGDGELDLVDMLEGLWRRKLLIVLVTFLVTGVAVAYALLSTPTYQARVFVQPPSQNDIAHLNNGRGGDSGLDMVTVKDVYEIYLRSLQSESLRREFFQRVYLPSLSEGERAGSQDELYARFQSVLSLGSGGKDNPMRYFIRAELPDPNQAAEWVVAYAKMAGQRGVDEIIKDVKAEATTKANSIEQGITAARESARRQREDEIVQLNEALRVARAIGLEKPPIISNSLTTEVSAGMDGSLTYMRGSKAIEAEIENLESRASDDPFVSNLRQRQHALGFYRGLPIDANAIQVYRLDGAIDSPDRPIKPKKALIVVLGLVMGIMSGITLALLRNLRWGRRERILT